MLKEKLLEDLKESMKEKNLIRKKCVDVTDERRFLCKNLRCQDLTEITLGAIIMNV